jgi:hypothetical protein
MERRISEYNKEIESWRLKLKWVKDVLRKELKVKEEYV